MVGSEEITNLLSDQSSMFSCYFSIWEPRTSFLSLRTLSRLQIFCDRTFPKETDVKYWFVEFYIQLDQQIWKKKSTFPSYSCYKRGKLERPKHFLYQAVNMFISAVKSDILTWESMGPESLLELQWTLEELQHFLDARLKQMIQTLSAGGDTEASISQSAPVLWLSLQCYCLV